MIANFHIAYGTKSSEQIAIQLKRKGSEEVLVCQSFDQINWHAALQEDENEPIEYKYLVQSLKGMLVEHGPFRRLNIPRKQNQAFFQDYWRAEYEPTRAFFSSAFCDVIFKRGKNAIPASRKLKTPESKHPIKNKLVLQLNAAAIPQHLTFCVLGSTEALGKWREPVILTDGDFPIWKAEIELDTNVIDFEYKFAVYDPARAMIVEWEGGENRRCSFTFPLPEGNVLVRTDEVFRYQSGLWRGAGVAVPVFSLRSEKGLGIGEFTDLHPLVDWAVKTGMKLVQVLPVNDTIATKTWTDSYPYAAISIYALHPLNVNIQAIAELKDKKAAARLNRYISTLNELESIDFEKVLKHKFEFFKLLFEQEKTSFFESGEGREFITTNAGWLKPYAAFCHLRDTEGTINFNTWKKYSVFSQAVIDDLCSPQYQAFDEVALYYFIQFHAHRQLFGATAYARRNGVVLKGDLPIGIYRYSCDAWVAPHLYNMNGQAGAPPDAYAAAGQNWGFPTYNWEVMAKDDFAWWRQRMTKLSEYFDALRIDHILGFFRIWEIPVNQVEGTLGLFNPRLPYSLRELDAMGLRGNLDRFTRPYIRGHFLPELFGNDTDFVRSEFLEEIAYGEFKLKDFVDNQLKIKELFSKNKKYASKKKLEKGLMQLVGEVVLIEEPQSNGMAFNPRITVQTTRSYQELDQFTKYAVDRLYHDYFYQRHDEFWRQQAQWKLPALIRATNMLICGEDLGMIPKSVPGVMQDLNIISLEIQRMPKGATEFGETWNYPYMSVCSPSCHDMSTIRGWWESDYGRARNFYSKILGMKDAPPRECTPEIVEAINKQHLDAPSMWAIFPLQDLVGMDPKLRKPDAASEQINDPSNPHHYWRFRFHLPMEQLTKEEALNRKIKGMIEAAGR